MERVTRHWPEKTAVALVVMILATGISTVLLRKSVFDTSIQKRRVDDDRSFQYISDCIVKSNVGIPSDTEHFASPSGRFSWRVQAAMHMVQIPINLSPTNPTYRHDLSQLREHGGKYFAETGSGGPRIAKLVVGGAINEANPARLVHRHPSAIIFVEVTHLGDDWMAPREVEVNEIRQSPRGTIPAPIGSQGEDFFRVIFADGEMWRLSMSLPSKLLLKFATSEAGVKLNRDSELKPYRVHES